MQPPITVDKAQMTGRITRPHTAHQGLFVFIRGIDGVAFNVIKNFVGVIAPVSRQMGLVVALI